WHAWVWSLGIIAGAIVLALIIHSVVFFVLKRMAQRHGSVFVRSLVSHGYRPFRWILPLLGLTAAFPAARLSENVQTPLERAVGLGIIAAVAWMVILTSQIVADLLSARYRIDIADNLAARRIQTQIEVLHRVVIVVVVVVALSVMLMTFPTIKHI